MDGIDLFFGLTIASFFQELKGRIKKFNSLSCILTRGCSLDLANTYSQTLTLII